MFCSLLLNSQESILNIGHRGAKGHIAENTIASIHKAIELGADGIEIDVFQCKSGEIVLFHDKTLEKLTNGDGNIEDKNLEELRKLKVLNSSYSIPTLEEVLKSIGKDVFLNIELKGRNTAEGSLNLIKKYIERNKIEFNNILFSSFNWEELKDLRSLSDKVQLALITEQDPLLAIDYALKLKAVAINPNYKDLNEQIISKINEKGLKIYTWTVNSKIQIDRLKVLNVNGIITDFPDRF
ncbi:glycerophosphodiester phosphodiesterase family protein [Flavobacteriaceae bacterium]|nr:glycerophosphodiester phosphodiesterase family protein [Flavobacteriaceae bacterium]